jgi:hypothetical protein
MESSRRNGLIKISVVFVLFVGFLGIITEGIYVSSG